MSLLREIQADAINASVPVDVLLRKCRLLSARLKHDELKQWALRELDGYGSDAPLPNYRQFRGQGTGHFSGPFGSGIKNGPIAASLIPEKMRDTLTHIRLRQGIAGLAELVEDADTNPRMVWPAETSMMFGEDIYPGYNMIQGWTTIPTSFITGILSTVRNRVLDFAIEIEAQNPDAGEAPLNTVPIPPENVTQIFNQTIYGAVGNAGQGTNLNQTASFTVNQGDFASLEKALKSQGVEAADVAELATALKEESQKPAGDSFGPKVAKWMGGMITKAASGTWKIGSTVAANLLSAYLKSYYGMGG